MQIRSTFVPYQEDRTAVHAIPVLQDNIIWVWTTANQAVVIDPAIAEPVQHWLKERNLNLVAVLQTHHHYDHIGGTQGLLKTWPNAAVVASSKDLDRIPFQTVSVQDGEEISLMGALLNVMEVVGHTSTHIAYFIPPNKEKNITPALFCGDTLFGAGCGRLFEGTAEEMYLSLQRIASLPEDTQVYCAHEYTESNLRWAYNLRPNDNSIFHRLKHVEKLRKRGETTLPSTISEEKRTNLFLRARNIQEFAELRLDKDNWR